MNYLKEIYIDFNKIKRMNLKLENKSYDYLLDENIIQKNTKYFFESLFSLNNLENNLIYLNLYFSILMKINPESFEKINEFKSLRYLYISSLNFNSNFIIKLNTLKVLLNIFSKNLLISEKTNENLEVLILSNNNITNINNVLETVNLEKLKELDLSNNKIADINALENVNFK